MARSSLQAGRSLSWFGVTVAPRTMGCENGMLLLQRTRAPTAKDALNPMRHKCIYLRPGNVRPIIQLAT